MTQSNLSESEVIQYLQEHTDFFIRNRELLTDLKVSNSYGKIASLANHQVNTLQERNAFLKEKLNKLILHATENEKIISHVFELSLQLSQISHVANVTKHFSAFVKQHFNADIFRLVIPAYDNLETSKNVLCVEDETEFFRLFKDFMEGNSSVCGRLKKETLQFVFNKKSEKVGSSVMLPIGKNAKKGILIFASFDETRFIPDMSTDILSKLTNMLEIKLKNSFSSFNLLSSNQG